MGERRRRIDKVLDPEFLVDLPEWPLDELRRRHAECLEIETEVSYVRRMTQARIDILEAELDRRASGGSVGDLIAALPEILADEGPRPTPSQAHLPQRMAPSPDIEWTRGLEPLVGDSTLARLPDLSDAELADAREQLAALEHEVSAKRRALHEVLHTLEMELAERIQAARS